MTRRSIGRGVLAAALLLATLASPVANAQPATLDCGAPWNPYGLDFAPCGTQTAYDVPDDFCDYFACIPSFWESVNGYAVQCRDGLYSHSGGRRGVCSFHSGETPGRALYGP
jgi:hypothetical protein